MNALLISYLIFAILVSIITCLFLFFVLMEKNDFISKRAYVIYGLPLSVWILFAAAIYKGRKNRHIICLLLSLALCLSPRFSYTKFSNTEISRYMCSFFSLVLAAAQLAVAFLPYSIFL